MAVYLKIDANVATIVIDRADSRNSIDQATAHDISVSLGMADANRVVRAIIITGAGGHFCAGADVDARLRGEVMCSPTNGFAGVTRRVVTKPLIAAVEGQAAAEGFEMALACDMIVAAEDAQFGLSQVQRGLVADAGGLLGLPRQMPPKIAAELVMTGAMVSAGFLAEHGMINRIVPHGEALASAIALAATIAANDPDAIAISKQILKESPGWPASEMFEQQEIITAPFLASLPDRPRTSQFAKNDGRAEPDG